MKKKSIENKYNDFEWVVMKWNILHNMLILTTQLYIYIWLEAKNVYIKFIAEKYIYIKILLLFFFSTDELGQ